jgi:phosphoglycolate phosphatase-like HAD superfamily hydrolase
MTIGHSLVIFDVEGTLVDSATLTLRCWQETLQSFGFEFSLATLQRHSGQDPHDMLHELLLGPRVTRVLPRVIEAQGRLYRDKYLPQVTAFPHVRALFERVKRGRQRIAVATSSSADELDHYLALANVGDLVDAVACGDDVQHDKPDSALIEVALLRAGKLAPKDAIMIGDTPYDAIAAKRLGVGLSECCPEAFRDKNSRRADASRSIAIRPICWLAMRRPSACRRDIRNGA